jgi:hypothetical protein
MSPSRVPSAGLFSSETSPGARTFLYAAPLRLLTGAHSAMWAVLLLAVVLASTPAHATGAEARPATLGESGRRADEARILFEGGVTAYRAYEFRLAAELFQDSIKMKPTTGALRNLGNAEWQRGQVGRAVLAWEQALWLDPFDRLARGNLEYARKNAQIDPPELAWHEATSLYLPTSWWAWLAGLSLWVAIGAAILPVVLRVRKATWHQAVAALGLAGFLLTIPAHFGISGRAKLGFVLERETPLRLTPTAEAQAITRLASGEPARVETQRGEFLLVRTGRARGWLHVADFGAICPNPDSAVPKRSAERAIAFE